MVPGAVPTAGKSVIWLFVCVWLVGVRALERRESSPAAMVPGAVPTFSNAAPPSPSAVRISATFAQAMSVLPAFVTVNVEKVPAPVRSIAPVVPSAASAARSAFAP